MAPRTLQPKVFRLRNLPADVDRFAATKLLAATLDDPGVTPGDIEIFSLADTAEPSDKWQIKVATLAFKQIPAAFVQQRGDGSTSNDIKELRLSNPALNQPLILDTHFYGFTSLNEVRVSDHEFDCIAISGLASHPFGSWQPRGGDKLFMWIRDVLTEAFPRIRFLIYGYDTTIAKSRSFQTIVDLSRTFILELEANGWASSVSKPFFILAHSLGGVLFKQSMVMLADGNDRAKLILGKVRGAICFGTPSTGMPISSLLAMVENQPNQDLVEALSERSSFLKDLEVQFSGISYIKRLKLFWAYETETSPTVEKGDDGLYRRSPISRAVMVDKNSATGGRYVTDPASVIQINEDHSGMVKFGPSDHRIPILKNKIRDICWPEHYNPALYRFHNGLDGHNIASSIAAASFEEESLQWDHNLVLQTIRFTEGNKRLEQIVSNSRHTFQWAFDDPTIGLSTWLRRGSDIFWISGKPGSGKSTFMKFLLQDKRTTELLHSWKSTSKQIIGAFFFHHRGTLLQKSFDGLLRSLLSQLLEEEPRLRAPVIDPILDAQYQDNLKFNIKRTLQADVTRFMKQYDIPMAHSSELTSHLSQDPLSQLDSLMIKHLHELDFDDRQKIKRLVLEEFKVFSNPIGALTIPEHTTVKALEKVQNLSLDDFKSLIREWHSRINLQDVIKRFLVQKSFYRKEGTVEEEDYVVYEEYINELARNQRLRQQLRIDVQLAAWDRPQLEEGIRNAFNQDTLDLQVCLFFDALDEYDGQPEVISEFVKDLVQRSTTSKTVTKILFSSRPWPIFLKEFEGVAGFRIHDHTQRDMQEYSTSSIPNTKLANTLIRPLVDEVVGRARGVFLWVTLVMKELRAIVEIEKGTAVELSARLRHCLNAVPDELDDYYTTIVQRLPLTTRRETYILLECLSRSFGPITLGELPALFACALSPSYEDAKREVHKERSLRGSDMDEYVKNISGGLVEIVAPDTLQLLHQTCKEWIESSVFKHAVLGDQASTIWENGHGYLFKYLSHMEKGSFGQIYQDRVSDILKHLAEAESTTGVSQHAYLSTMPARFYMSISPSRSSWTTRSNLSLAVSINLRLLLQDCLIQDKSIVARSTEPLLSILLRRNELERQDHGSIRSGRKAAQEVVEMGKSLFQHGFNIKHDPTSISFLTPRLWDSPDSETAELYVELIKLAVKDCPAPDAYVWKPAKDASSSSLSCPLLHMSPPTLASWLLGHGISANDTNSLGQTALDYVIEPNSIHQTCIYGMDWLYEIVCLLVQHGGELRTCSKRKLELFKAKLTLNGYDASVLALLRPVSDISTPLLLKKIPSTPNPNAMGSQTQNPKSRSRKRDKVLKLFGTS